MNASTAQSCSMTRRTALRTMAVATATGAISQLHAQPPGTAPLAGQPVKPSLRRRDRRLGVQLRNRARGGGHRHRSQRSAAGHGTGLGC